ncbi:MAG: 2-hydroxyacid dehydrogenase [Ruminococcaceae bacterium]|nr:2-hydroxyacid dehydrogenase [Oscillospiraceae bacterium]
MEKICFYNTKSYDKKYFDKLKDEYSVDVEYFRGKLREKTAVLSAGYDAVVAFVNDDIDEKTINTLYDSGIRILALRCAGFNNVDLKAAYGKIHIVRVPAYSPYAVAEHAMGMLLSLVRKIPRAYNRIRDYNFTLDSLVGFDLYGKTVGIIGTGKIGKIFIEICKGFGMKICAYDPFPAEETDIEYVSIEELCKKSDIISLHCPLNDSTRYIINKRTISLMKDNVYIINTSRGALIDSEALLEGLKSEKIGGACLDVYEEETDYFYEDKSDKIIHDDILTSLIGMNNVLVTSHQAFLTDEALHNITTTTLENLRCFFDGKSLENEVCIKCANGEKCKKNQGGRCF